MDLTSDKGRVCIWPYHGMAHQLFTVLQIKLVTYRTLRRSSKENK